MRDFLISLSKLFGSPNNPKNLVQRELGMENADIFSEWAFGPGFREITLGEIPNAWNNLHGDKLIIHDNGRPDIDLLKMIEIWREND